MPTHDNPAESADWEAGKRPRPADDRTMSASDWQDAYEGASANGARLGDENARLRADLDARNGEIRTLRARVAALECEVSTCDARIDNLARALRAVTHTFVPDRWSRNPSATTQRCLHGAEFMQSQCAHPEDAPIHRTPEVVLGADGEWFGREVYTGREPSWDSGRVSVSWDTGPVSPPQRAQDGPQRPGNAPPVRPATLPPWEDGTCSCDYMGGMCSPCMDWPREDT